MTELADVSVVTPAWNAAATIERALASIAAQTVRPREAIVVDDGSTDETVEVVRGMAGRMNGVRLRLFSQPNSGAGAARNRALAEASGAWVAFLDSDDAWLPAKLARSIAFNEREGLAMSAHNLFGLTEAGEHLIDSHARWLKCRDDPYAGLFLRGFISSSTVLVRRDAILAAGGFDPALRSAQDYEMWLTILRDRRNRFAMFDEPLLRYTITAQGITGQVDRKVKYSMAILRRHAAGLGLGPVLLRAAIIHYEAMSAHRQRGNHAAALGALLRLPGRALGALAGSGGGWSRPNFLADLVPAREIVL